jgi:hypothetical protein
LVVPAEKFCTELPSQQSSVVGVVEYVLPSADPHQPHAPFLTEQLTLLEAVLHVHVAEVFAD